MSKKISNTTKALSLVHYIYFLFDKYLIAF